MRRKGFTLIELLVVIAIIALLLSVMLPSLRKAKQYAKRIIDITNLRSLSTGLHIYLNSNNDRFFDYGVGMLWMDRVGDTVDNLDDIRYCPETTAKMQEVRNAFDGSNRIWGTSTRPWLWNSLVDPSLPPALGSYGLNGWLYARNGPIASADEQLRYSNRASIRNPVSTPFILDSYWVDGWPKNTNVLPETAYDYSAENGTDHGGTNSSSSTMIGRFVTDRHGPETNVIFIDGQVRTISHAELWTLSWHKNSQPRFDVRPPQPIPAKK